MKEKLTRLSKGITDTETPVISIIPESFCYEIFPGRANGFRAELVGENGAAAKGICFPDSPRINIEPRTFAGRRIHFSIAIDSTGLKAGDKLDGRIMFVTSAGEFALAYTFSVTDTNEGGRNIDSGSGTDPALMSDFDVPAEAKPERVVENPLRVMTSARQAEGTDIEDDEQYAILCSELPEDEALFEGVLAALIRSENASGYAFAMYGEAIKRGVNMTGLYESYVYAYPDDHDEPMPREVYIYFSYESYAEHGLLKKLYKNILLHLDTDSELYNQYEAAISSFTINAAFKELIDNDLALMYDRMIYPGMIDTKAAGILPDIFKCSRFDISKGDADYLTVSYKGLERAWRSDIINGESFVPVYFNDAEFKFYRFNEYNEAVDVSNEIIYERKELFARPDILRRCFELAPEHEMLLLSAVREISGRGINGDEEIGVIRRAFNELEVSRELRASLIESLCDYGKCELWEDMLKEEDNTGAACGKLFKALCNADKRDVKRILSMIRQIGPDKLDLEALAGFVSSLIEAGEVPCKDREVSPYFIAVAKLIFDYGSADEVILDFLAEHYESASEDMYALMQSLKLKGRPLKELPEKILAVKLFTGSREHIDESFESYIDNSRYTEFLLRAYLTERCADAFLHEEEVGDIMYEALRSYFKGSSEPLNMPLIYRLALTSFYADLDSLDEEETKLCAEITDDLIASGLIFRYTKKLRKKISIPEDICMRFYVQFNATTPARPKLLTRILPDNNEYRVTDMQHVYKNIYIMSTVLFKGDELQYLIYNNDYDDTAAEEGIISVKKYHRQRDEVFASLDTMTRAIEDRDIGLLRENMLEYAERTETVKLLFDLEN